MAEPLNVVVDLSHHNASVDFGKLKADGIVGVIYKATQGLTFVDKSYAPRRKQAREAGLLWGAYHFGVGGDGSDQADFFLEKAEPDADTLLVLDYEPNLTGPTMTLTQAREFVEHVANVTGRFPGLYSGHLIKEQLGGGITPDPILSNCFLWIAQYKGPKPLNIPPTFSTWTLWQYTDGVMGPGPHEVNGAGRCDRNMFNGSLAQLNKLWGVA
ncbi:MAG TPA: glycoside hydrolase family 25 protein [Albitalea sp.]|nr:glycoside hydrolase family 25 protein [Albitalea sp.]